MTMYAVHTVLISQLLEQVAYVEDHQIKEDEDDMQYHSYHQLKLAHHCLGILQSYSLSSNTIAVTYHSWKNPYFYLIVTI